MSGPIDMHPSCIAEGCLGSIFCGKRRCALTLVLIVASPDRGWEAEGGEPYRYDFTDLRTENDNG